MRPGDDGVHSTAIVVAIVKQIDLHFRGEPEGQRTGRFLNAVAFVSGGAAIAWSHITTLNGVKSHRAVLALGRSFTVLAENLNNAGAAT
jgi:hypothetical protein